VFAPGRRRWCLCLALSLGAAWLAAGPAAAADSGKKALGLVVLDARTGQERWHKSLPAHRYFGPPGLGARRVVAAEVPSCSEYGPDDPAPPRLSAFDAKTGERLWSAKGYSYPLTRTMQRAPTPSVGVAAQGVVVTYGGRDGMSVVGLDAKTGKVRWRIGPNEQYAGGLSVSPTLVFGSGPTPTVGNALVAFDRRTGTDRWVFPPAADPAWGTNFEVAAADEDTVVIANGPFNTISGDRAVGPSTLFVLDARTGSERTRITGAYQQMQFSDIVIHDGLLIYADGPNVQGRDLRDGAVRWVRIASEVGPPPFFFVPAARMLASSDGSTIFIGESRSFTEALDAQTGVTRWSKPPPPSRYPVASDVARVIFGEGAAELAGVDAPSGEQLWQRDISRYFPGGWGDVKTAVRDRTLAMSRVCRDQ
jgi:outer membrane protein assembly factor BamB